MKKFLLLFILLSFFGIIYFHKDPTMKLVNTKSGFVVVEYQGDKTIFHDRMLEKEMQMRGIIIPPALRSEYGGKSTVRMNEKEFQKAFKEIYSKQAFSSQSYEWSK
jgi:hypothetical protein